MHSIKTLVIITSTFRRIGGLEIVTIEAAKAFRDLGLKVKVYVLFDDEAPEKINNVEVVRLCPKLRILRGLWKRVFWRPLTVILLIFTFAFCRKTSLIIFGHAHLLPLLDFLPHIPRVRRWLWAHGIEVWGEQAVRWAKRINRLDRVISVSRFTREQLISGGVTIPISVIPDSVDTSFFIPTNTPSLIRRNEVLIVGRLSSIERYKGHDILLESIPLVEELLGRRISLRIVGEGDDIKRLQLKAKILGVADRVIFMGKVDMLTLLEVYQHCGVFCMPSRLEKRQGYWAGEGFGLVYIEAAACGRPVIASKQGGAAETIVPEVTGFLVNPTSHKDIADAIVKILSDPCRADEMGRHGRNFVEQEFSRQAFMRRLVQTIEEDLKSPLMMCKVCP